MDKPNPILVAAGRFGLGLRGAAGGSAGDSRNAVEASLSSLLLPSYGSGLKSAAEQIQTMQRRRTVVAALNKDKVAASRMDMSLGTTPPEAEGVSRPSGMAMSDTMSGPGGREDAGAMRRRGRAGPHPAVEIPRTVSRSDELDAWLSGVVDSPSPLQERLALYWGNHFTVSAVKGKVGLTVAPYQREAIRPFILASFHDLLLATVTHPAMLFYLDNDVSVGPNSDVGKRKRSGLNENLAREILELHTLGASGGYGQDDVSAFAAVLTGWQVDLNIDSERCGRSFFDPRRHEPGAKRILGKVYPDAGQDQLLAVLKDLAVHPATARNVATRFARSFVSDPPPPALVDALARDFLSTRGDVAALARTLVRHDAAWTTPLRKLRPPMEFIAATARLLGSVPLQPKAEQALLAMGQPFLTAPSPKGWPEGDDGWVTSDGIKTRVDWTQDVASHHAQGLDMKALVNDVLRPVLSDETRTAILRAESREQALTLLLMSPDFQRR